MENSLTAKKKVIIIIKKKLRLLDKLNSICNIPIISFQVWFLLRRAPSPLFQCYTGERQVLGKISTMVLWGGDGFVRVRGEIRLKYSKCRPL